MPSYVSLHLFPNKGSIPVVLLSCVILLKIYILRGKSGWHQIQTLVYPTRIYHYHENDSLMSG